MKIKKSTPLLLTGALLVSSLGATIYAQGHNGNKMPKAAPPKMGMMQGNMAGCDKMMANMKAADAKLDSLAAKMNAAKGFDKVNAMAALTNEMVAQRKMMHAQMQIMHQQMMGDGMNGQGMKGQGMMGQGTKGQGMKGQGMENQTAMRDKMMANMKSADAKLDSLAAKMNAAKGFDKVNAMAALTNEMVAQRKMMRSQMQAMHQQMMGKGMNGQGMMGGGMMGQGMMGKPDTKPDTKPDEHAQHH